MRKIIILVSFFAFLFTFAQDSISVVEGKIYAILGNIIKFLFSILMLAGSALFIYLGILYILGKTKIGEETTSKAILYIVLGIVLLITSFFIPNLIKNFIRSQGI